MAVLVAVLLWGCATPGQKFIHMNYLGSDEAPKNQMIGLAQFIDMRPDADEKDQGYIGYRQLMGDERETYHVYGLNLLKALNHVTEKHLDRKGMDVQIIEAWEPSLEGVEKMKSQAGRILTATVNRFECRARKKAMTTQMTLDIDMIFYLGQTDRISLKKIPVSLTLERTEIGFTAKKLEAFVSQSITEVLEKALVF